MKEDRMESLFSPETEEGLEKVRKFAEAEGFGDFFHSVSRAFGHHINCERAYRRGKRAKAMRRSGIKEIEDEKEQKQHRKSMSEVDVAIRQLKEGRKRLRKERLKEMDDLVKDPTKFKEYRKAIQDFAFDQMLEQEIDPVVTEEIVVIFDDLLENVVHEKGANGLLDHIEDRLEKLKTLRTEGKNRGRDEHLSPLVHPKVLWLGALLGFSALIGIWCWLTGQDVLLCLRDFGILFHREIFLSFLICGC